MTTYRVYIDSRVNVFYIQGVSSGPVMDYVVSKSGNNVSIFRPSLQVYDLSLIPYQYLLDQNGNAFPDANTCINYLTALTVYHGPITAVYPLVLDSSNNNLSLDKMDLQDGGNF